MNYQAIIFDFDGVLFDSEKIHLQASNQVFQPLGFTIQEAEYFQHYVGMADNEMFNLILNKKNITYNDNEYATFKKNKISAFQTIINQSATLNGVANVKQFLEVYSKIINNFAICSAASREEIDVILDKLENGELRKYFKHIVSINDTHVGKPSPQGYLLAAKLLNLPPQDCLAIEDTAIGIAAAKSAGMHVVGLTTTHHPSALKQADFIANNYNEIDHWLATQ